MDNVSRYQHLSGLTLAYVGDAVFELYVRKHLIYSGSTKPNELHQQTITFVSAKSQARIVLHWLENDLLTKEEERVVARGRNAKTRSIPKHTNVQTYRYSTGFEALIGYHYLLNNEERLVQLLSLAIQSSKKGQ